MKLEFVEVRAIFWRYMISYITKRVQVISSGVFLKVFWPTLFPDRFPRTFNSFYVIYPR